MTEKDIIQLIDNDKWMMDVLKAVEKLNLPDWWIGAGFVRSKVWDHLHNYTKRTPLPDIDVIYFDSGNNSEETEKNIERKLAQILPGIRWSVKNQARMHILHNRAPYKNSTEALSQWAETATCVGVKIDNNELSLTAAYGISDLVNLIIRPIPDYDRIYSHRLSTFDQRYKSKNWLKKWPKLKVQQS